jgi:NAD(P)-dependent dehydrogenase (short-subunit alcohol dehydrogenase family)
VVDAAIQKFGSIDVVVNNAGIFSVKPFTEYSADDFRALVSTNLEGYIYITPTRGQADARSEVGRKRCGHYVIVG